MTTQCHSQTVQRLSLTPYACVRSAALHCSGLYGNQLEYVCQPTTNLAAPRPRKATLGCAAEVAPATSDSRSSCTSRELKPRRSLEISLAIASSLASSRQRYRGGLWGYIEALRAQPSVSSAGHGHLLRRVQPARSNWVRQGRDTIPTPTIYVL